MNTWKQQFSSPMVRHLAWSLLSAPLARLDQTPAFHPADEESVLEWLTNLDAQPEGLTDYIQSQNHRLLGSYFECLWQFYLDNGPNCRLIAHHVQVIHNKQTLGELDILSEINGQALHLELAVKFYLQAPETSGREEHHWLGPQTRDRLDLKLSKLRDKQFPFLHDPHTQQTLMLQEFNQPFDQALSLKGYLFHQYGKAYDLPLACRSNTLIGRWLHQKQIGTLLEQHEHWAIIPKHEWLGDFSCPQHTQELPAASIQKLVDEHFENQKINYALMLVALAKDGSTLIEQNRFFIVANQWPDL